MPVDISTAELRTILRMYPGRKRDGTRRTRGEEALRTIMSAVTTHYRRVHGEDSASLGDLTWITADSYEQDSASPTTQPIKENRAHPDARGVAQQPLLASGVRRLTDNLRSVLLSAAVHIKASPDVGEDEKKSLLDAWDAEYRELTDIAQRLQHDEDLRVLRGQLSDRQTKNWINWDTFVDIVKPLTQEAITVFGGPDAAALATERSHFKALQTNVLLSMYALLPPVRNDFPGIRFVESPVSMDDVRATGSPNYIEVAQDGSMELVINAFKTDGHTAADDYDPANGDFVLGMDTTLRIPLVPNDTLAKFGFAPDVLGTLLGLYRRTVRTIFGDRNEHEYLFFDFGPNRDATPVKGDALGKRVGRRLKALTGGKAPRTQLFRTMFCTWFLNEADPSPTRAERQLMADMMMHSESKQLCNYNKRVTRSAIPEVKRQRTLVPEEDETNEETGEL